MEMKSYFDGFDQVLKDMLAQQDNRQAVETALDCIRQAADGGHTVFMVGNGGSAAICEHMSVDLNKNAGVSAMAFSGTPYLTALSNDYGYERVYEKALEMSARKMDVLLAISSSGTSRNILNAVDMARKIGMKVITLSGFGPDNPLRKTGDGNIYVPSRSYGYVEILHNLIIHYLNDAIIGKVEYPAS